MKISEVIKNITEIQNQHWVESLSESEVHKIENQFWLIWEKLKLINDPEIIGPLERIAKLITINKYIDGKYRNTRVRIDFKHFYLTCVKNIPKKKYKFIYPRKKKSKSYDYDFLKLLAKDLGESITNCEEYLDIYKQLDIYDKVRMELFSKYGVPIYPKSNDTIEYVDINSIKQHPKNQDIYTKSRSVEDKSLLENIEIYGLLQPLVVDSTTNYIISGNRRYKCCKELGVNQVQVIKRKIKYDIIDLINFNKYRNKSQKEKLNEYRTLQEEIKKLGYKERKKMLDGIGMREYIFQQTGTSQTQKYRLEFIEKNNLKLFNQVVSGQVSTLEAYNYLKGLTNKTSKINVGKIRLKLRDLITEVSPFINKKDIIEMIDEIY